jgi:hypothetical protein
MDTMPPFLQNLIGWVRPVADTAMEWLVSPASRQEQKPQQGAVRDLERPEGQRDKDSISPSHDEITVQVAQL